MDVLGALQSLGGRIVGLLPNIMLRKFYPEAYFKSHILINMGDSTPALALHPKEHRMWDLHIAITNLLPFKIEISFNQIEIGIGNYSPPSIYINQTKDVARISRLQIGIPIGVLPDGLLHRILESKDPHPLLTFRLSYRVRALRTFNAETNLSAYVPIMDYSSAAGVKKASKRVPKGKKRRQK